MTLCSATYDCPHCGGTHLAAGGEPGLRLVIENGPDRAGTVAELWPNGNYPPAVAEKLKALRWCSAVGEYVAMDDPARLTIGCVTSAGDPETIGGG